MARKPVLKFKKLNPKVQIPQYAHDNDAGCDLFSLEHISLRPGQRHVFQLGIASEIPKGYFISVRDKSSVPAKFGLHTLGGVIDEGYRGEWAVILINLSDKKHVVEVGDKLAQAVLQPVVYPRVKEVKSISETKRGAGGFGSTGRK